MPHIPAPSPGLPGSSHSHTAEPHSLDPRQLMATRELFWQNVIREMLTSLSMMCTLRPAVPAPSDSPDAEGPIADDAEDPETGAPVQAGTAHGDKSISPPLPANTDRSTFDAQLFDGRLAIITRRGERIPIADVFPLFACGIDTPRERMLSVALECTVFQIRTPAGEVYTLPLHEIGSFQALTPDLMRRLAQMARKQQKSDQQDVQQPFGFAAFTSIARETPPPMTDDAEEPAE